MTATAGYFGAIAVYSPNGTCLSPKSFDNGIATNYSTVIPIGAPVTINATTGKLELASATGAGGKLAGFFAGCSYVTSGGYAYRGHWPGGAAYRAGTMVAEFYDDTDIMFEMQANGSVTEASRGALFDFVAGAGAGGVQAVGINNGLSAAALNATPSATGQMQCVDIRLSPDNAWGDAYTILRVRIANPILGAATANF